MPSTIGRVPVYDRRSACGNNEKVPFNLIRRNNARIYVGGNRPNPAVALPEKADLHLVRMFILLLCRTSSIMQDSTNKARVHVCGCVAGSETSIHESRYSNIVLIGEGLGR
ncbi:hypothetical protein C8J25_101705 [Sphingomonas faeni]|uniref:Uncharacterized protein n=1 Tax=Sphingomonas faeni TaxID=185950 RepID=A0A2T5UCF8_9SPHN|nr:hypothetical protein C8J25_101705 [Sphingomonas faeni]